MKVKFLTSVGGVDFSHQAGETYEIDDNEAIRYIEANIATAIDKNEYSKIADDAKAAKEQKEKEEELANNIVNLEALTLQKENIEKDLEVLTEKIATVQIALGYKTLEKTLIEKYNEDKNIVDTLNVSDLKSLCKDLGIKFTKEDEIREHLKTMEPLEDK